MFRTKKMTKIHPCSQWVYSFKTVKEKQNYVNPLRRKKALNAKRDFLIHCLRKEWVSHCFPVVKTTLTVSLAMYFCEYSQKHLNGQSGFQQKMRPHWVMKECTTVGSAPSWHSSVYSLYQLSLLSFPSERDLNIIWKLFLNSISFL